MKTVFIDYSGSYGSGRENAAPPGRRNGKFVQLRRVDREYLVFSPPELTPYHADIVERFCRDRDIDGSYNAQKKSFEIHDPDWAVAGGGKFEVDASGKHLRLFDNSMAYGRFDSRGLRERILQIDAFREYEVIID